MAMAGAELLIYPTAIGWDRGDDSSDLERQRQAWVTIQRSHAIANGVPVLSVNRVGYEEGPSGRESVDFWGTSFVAGPQGEILYCAGTDAPENVLVKIDLSRTTAVRRIRSEEHTSELQSRG